ncbi:GNAT family N-acetyltransferase [Pokkaliibacter sp. CJK22405]|uniref:GNAT family N-acetyltransferase n=1 Tax=Pokkaliibacter sp. CJK22405 TaxID=3384615 RepID=UPI0039854E24
MPTLVPFSELTTSQLYHLLKLRQDVFILEQQCLYPDIDGIDPESLHCLWETDGQLDGYIRVIPEPDQARIGRVVLRESARGTGLAGKLMAEVVRLCEERFPEQDQVLSAQAHLVGFYGRFGFVEESEEYLEDGIPHVDMRKTAAS